MAEDASVSEVASEGMLVLTGTKRLIRRAVGTFVDLTDEPESMSSSELDLLECEASVSVVRVEVDGMENDCSERKVDRLHTKKGTGSCCNAKPESLVILQRREK